MQCKCTEPTNCNPCTNTTRFSDLCAECYLANHTIKQSKISSISGFGVNK